MVGVSIAVDENSAYYIPINHKNPEDKKRVKEAIKKIKNIGGLDFAEKKMKFYRFKALEILKSLPESPYRNSLELMVNYVIERTI